MKATRIGKALALCAWIATQGLAALPAQAEDTGRRQNVERRIHDQAQGMQDLVDIRTSAQEAFRTSSKHQIFNGTAIRDTAGSGSSGSCGGYITSTCGVACCGKEECNRVCSYSRSSAHGTNVTCDSPYQTSPCGRTCCGKEDCDKVCINYNMLGPSECGGYTRTKDGEPCCGYSNCHDIECGFMTKATGENGGASGIACCGSRDCVNKECGGYTEVKSKVYNDENRKYLACCGKDDCHEAECDDHTSTVTPTSNGQRVACCGYEQCHWMECEGMFQNTNATGAVISCCGYSNCMAGMLMVSPDKNPVRGGDTVRVVASGGAPGVSAVWEIISGGDTGEFVSHDSVFDSTGRAYAQIRTHSPYHDITVKIHAVHNGPCPTCKWNGTLYE